MTLEGHTYTIGNVVIMPDQRLLSCGDNTVRVWNLTTQTCEVAFTADATVWTCDVTSDGTKVAAMDLAGQLHILKYNRS